MTGWCPRLSVQPLGGIHKQWQCNLTLGSGGEQSSYRSHWDPLHGILAPSHAQSTGWGGGGDTGGWGSLSVAASHPQKLTNKAVFTRQAYTDKDRHGLKKHKTAVTDHTSTLKDNKHRLYINS